MDIRQVIEEPEFGKIVVNTGAELEKIKKQEEQVRLISISDTNVIFKQRKIDDIIKYT